jgi:prepilin-type processing-associated H-X9-DG protein
MLLLGEETGGKSPEGSQPTSEGGTDDGFIWYTNYQVDVPSARHTGMSNCVMVDGHVKAFKPEQIATQNLYTGGTASADCP